jgi:alpha-beta hydrolase superfamily lysophospholipase
VISAHSTGGLIASLWANERRSQDRALDLVGMVLNSPWLDMQGGAFIRGLGTSIVKQVGARRPKRPIPRTVGGHYGRSLHADHAGEWAFNTDWKPLDSFPVSFGWLRAIRLGHDEVHRGLEVGCPVLVLSSSGTRWPKEMGPDAHNFDIVLEVPQIRQWATALGSHVTYVAIEGARHDVILSLPEPREKAYAELGRWMSTYVG